MAGQPPRGESLVQNWAAKGAISAGAIGAVVGLVVGLIAYPATAWFAVFEVGIPSFVLGGIVGCLSGAVAVARRRVVATRTTTNSAR
jgi:hypothetical protein